jgi:hypothetical protein
VIDIEHKAAIPCRHRLQYFEPGRDHLGPNAVGGDGGNSIMAHDDVSCFGRSMPAHGTRSSGVSVPTRQECLGSPLPGKSSKRFFLRKEAKTFYPFSGGCKRRRPMLG